MVERLRLKDRINEGGNYFTKAKTNLQFVPTGCTTLDLALSGGWAENRVANIVGDKSTGKTLLCIEASANFAIKHAKGKIRYREAEAAFDQSYAAALGMPIARVDFGDPIDTVEDLFEDLQKVIEKAKQPELYIVDSLDALSDRAELERPMDQGTYGAQKAKNLSQLFRRLIRKVASSHVTVIIVSQVRSKIGISFGRDTTRSGGRALDFYATQVLYLAKKKTLVKTVQNSKRPTGIRLIAKVDKNKIGLPGREAEFNIKFGYGIDDDEACYSYLKDCKQPVKDNWTLKQLQDAVVKHWYEVETSIIPKKPKYHIGGIDEKN